MDEKKFKTYVSPDGVSLTYWAYTSFRASRTREAVQRAITPITGDATEGRFSWLAGLVGHLHEVSFNLTPDAPDWLLDMRAWWVEKGAKAFETQDFLALFSGLDDLEELPITMLLLEGFNATRRDVLKAPDEVAPGSKEAGASDPDFLPAETPTLRVSTPTA